MAKQALAVIITVVAAVGLIGQNLPFIEALTSDRTGMETIALAHEVPPGATLMIAWGPRHFAVGFDRDVLGDLRDLRLVSHKADFRALLARAPLVTPDYTFYNQPVEWWQQQLNAPVFLHTVAPDLVQITTQPELAAPGTVTKLGPLEQSVTCATRTITLNVAWAAPQTPEQNLSVFVHLIDASGAVLAQADQSAPVYGRRPLTSWQPNEIVRDLYPLPRQSGATAIRFGLYRQLDNGSFDNVVDETTAVECK